MQRSDAPKNEQGFTLMELLLVMVIAGILASISTPSLLGMYNRARLNDAVNQVRGAIQEAQRQAMRKSTACTITLNAKTITSNNGCLLGNRTLDNAVTLSDGGNISFDFQGNITGLANPKTIRLSADSSTERCVVVYPPLGLVGVGTMNGTECQP